jgi:diaminopimelate epimerase
VNTGSRTIPFVKAIAFGNDFLLIDGTLAPQDIAAFTRRICDRHEGVGADGVEWMLPHFSVDVEIRLVNADGSPAEISGNGTRCVAAYVCAQKGKERVSILTGAGTKICSLTARRDSEYEFEVEMGAPVVENELALSLGSELGNEEVRGLPVSMGNPHYVMLVSKFPADWRERAAAVQRNPHFKEGVNVVLYTSAGAHDVNALFFERGAGETRSSGTGSCSAAVAAITAGNAKSPVRVHTPGGIQTVRKEGNNIFLRGTARLVCRGEFFWG